MTSTDRAKRLIFPRGDQLPDQELVLAEIGTLVEDRLLLAIRSLAPGVEEIPEALQYIAVDLIVKRFNRIGSEGMTSEAQAGYSASFDLTDDLEPYMADIKRYAASLKDEKGPDERTVRFY